MYNNYLNTAIILCLLSISNALYEDQVGKFDWKQSYIGRVKYSHIDNAEKRVFVATEMNVVAALNLDDGSLLWRKVLENDEHGKIHTLSVRSEVVTISGSGIVRGWNLKSGLLTYEWALPTESKAELSFDSNRVYLVKMLEGSLEVSAYHIKNGNPAGSPVSISRPWLNPRCVLDKGHVICVSADLVTRSLSLLDSSEVQVQVKKEKNDAAGVSSNAILAPLPSPYPSAVLEGSFVVALHQGSLHHTESLDNCISQAIRRSTQGPAIVCAQMYGRGYKFSSWEFSGEGHHSVSLVEYNSQRPRVTISSVSEVSPDIADTVYLLVGDDDSLFLLDKNGQIVWTREEALANVVSAEMVDLPVSDEEAAIEKEFADKEGGIIGMLYRRIHSHVVQMVQAFNYTLTLIGMKKPQDSAFSKGVLLEKDQFGLHKLIVLVTKSSKVYGLESNHGKIVWQFYLEELSPFSILGKQAVPFFLQRTGRHFSLPAIASIILKDKKTGLSSLYSFNPINGEPLFGGRKELGYKVKQSVLLGREDKEFIRGLLLVSSEDRVEVFPPSSRQVALDLHPSLYVFTLCPETGLLEGYTFTQPTHNSEELGVLKVWNVRLSPPIIEVGMKNKAERVHTQGRVLGDRSVLYKYINPHLIAVATATTDPVHKNLVTVFLIDTVSGAVMFSAAHKRALPPVFIVHSENWVVYSFFNDKSRRTEVISLDLYQGKTQRNTTEFSSVTEAPLEPYIERQAYIFPHNVMAMRETITEKGITNKHVLVGVSSGSVMEVPWALLDPHRSPDGREEGVLPYTPDLSLPQEAILTYNHSLPHIAGILTSPSALESTSLVLVYGLDLFYTRVAPSKTFDVLKDDFEYWLITLVLGGLISGAYITKRLASRKALRQAWK